MRCISRIFTVMLTALAVTVTAAQAQNAPDDHSVLIYGPTVSGGASSIEGTTAASQGFTVVVDDPVSWAARTTANFATFRAIIFGDPTCQGYGATIGAEANRTVWSPAITGNIVVIGTDPTYHSSFGPGGAEGGDQVVDSGIAFATADDQTGAYITLSCYYDGAPPNTPVPLLDQFGSFTVQSATCWNDSHIVASHPALAGLSDADLSNWECSSHEVFNSFPTDFLALVIAKGYNCPSPPGTGTNYGDGTCGTPYILARGEELVPAACGDGTVNPEIGEECDDGNTANNDGCSAQCKIERCGDGTVHPGEECDDGNNANGDGCSAVCTIEPFCGDGTVDPGEQCDDGNNVNGDGCSASCEIENEAPVCRDATAAISSIWPPNHKMVSVGPITGVTDPDGDPVTITVTHIMQDEPTNTQGDGNTSCDATTAPLQVRAERSGNNDGRFYHAFFTATDPGRLSCSGSVVVAVVPHDQSHAPVNQGPLYNSCPAP